jgi:hypothetical protein
MFHWSPASDTPKRICRCAASNGVAKTLYAGVEEINMTENPENAVKVLLNSLESDQ